MKKILFLFICVFPASMFAQEACVPYIKGYRCYEFVYFDSLNNILGKCVDSLHARYEVYATFKVDTNGNVTDLQLNDLPVLKSPQSIKTYVTKLLYLTNGKWVTTTKNNQRTEPMEMMYCFSFRRKNRTMKEAEIEDHKVNEYFFSEWYKSELLNKFSRFGGKTMFIFTDFDL